MPIRGTYRKTKDRLEYEKSKTTCYIKEAAELRKQVASLEGRLATIDKRHARELGDLQAKVDAANTRIKVYQKKKDNALYNARGKSKEIAAVREEMENFKHEISHLSRDFDWDKTTSRQQHIEVMLRTIITYNKLVTGGILTFNEFAFLLTGSQREFFSMDDLRDRYGELGWGWRKDFDACMEAGYFKRLYRKAIWHITLAGKERFETILKYIYEEKVGIYKEIKRMNDGK